jgi:hypothetical protein
MTPKRSALTLCALLAAFLTAVPVALASGYGGAEAMPTLQSQGGGAIAPGVPATPGDAALPHGSSISGAEALPAQDPTPTTPEGEEQPGATPNPDEPVMGPIDELPEDGADTAPGAESGSLPSTGLALAALSAVGLGLLLAGAALWPTSSWPPPRDRLRRSTTLR